MAKLIRCEVLDMAIEGKKEPEIKSFFADNPEQLMRQLQSKRLKLIRVVNMDDPISIEEKPLQLSYVPENTDPVISLDTQIMLPPPQIDESVISLVKPVTHSYQPSTQSITPKFKQFEVSGEKFRMDLSTGTLEKFTWVEVTNIEDYCLIQPSKTGDKQMYIQKGTLKKKDWVVQPNS